jgi:hypothetical protein
MSVQLDTPPSPAYESEGMVPYRALSALAVVSCVLGALSVLAFLDWTLAIVPAVGMVTGAIALWRIRKNPADMSGEGFAIVGVALSAMLMVGGLGRLSYAYVHEVPDGYQRLSYADLQPDPDVAGQVYPPEVERFEGQKVFVKGFVFPGNQTTGIKTFVLCRDNGTCCFGGQPKLTDRIQVTLKGPLSLNYSTRMVRLAGTFHVEPRQAVGGLGGVLYHLDADYLK